MTAQELHAADPDFRALVARWVRARRCPLVMVDYLLDREMYTQAECARWAATAPARPTDHPKFPRYEWTRNGLVVRPLRKAPYGPYPYPGPRGRWIWSHGHKRRQTHQDVPFGSVPGSFFERTAAGAILRLLDAWLLTEPVPKRRS